MQSSENVLRLPPSPILGNEKSKIRQFMHLSYSLYILILARIINRSIDNTIVVAPDPFSALVAFSSRKQKTFIVYEELDCFADLYTGIWATFISFLEKIALKRADLIISVSAPLLKRASEVNPNSILISNGANLRSFPNPEEKSRKPYIVYAGSMDEWAGLKLVIEAFPVLKTRVPWVKMKIIGDGKDRQALEKLVQDLSLGESISFIGKLLYDQMAAALCDCYIGVAMFKPCKAAVFSSPLKLFDYMAAGLPIVATDIGDIGRIIKESKSGIAVNWDINEFAEAIEEIFTKPDKWLELHENSLNYVKDYDWERLFDDWLQKIETRARQRNPE
jgi:glycosyltransferase involved in cell wall biosynthesis